MKKNIAIAIHGGAGQDSPYIREHVNDYKKGLKEAIEHGHKLLSKGAKAIDVVEATVRILEDNPFFNAGRGSALNREGEVEMDAAIMDGKQLMAGAVSMVRNVKNPIELARTVMHYTKHVHIAGEGALKLAKIRNLELQPNEYFITDHQRDLLLEETTPTGHGTVGCVAMDEFGHLAAATSTGGLTGSLPGRVGDSCLVGAGCYANELSASSCTGEGELIITSVIAHKVAMLMELKNMRVQEACDYVIRNMENPIPGDVGIISVDNKGRIAFSFNCQRMHRASIDTSGKMVVEVYNV